MLKGLRKGKGKNFTARRRVRVLETLVEKEKAKELRFKAKGALVQVQIRMVEKVNRLRMLEIWKSRTLSYTCPQRRVNALVGELWNVDPRPSHVPHYVVRGSLAICTSNFPGPK